MGIKHATSKVHGDKGLASEWNDDHVVDDDVDFSQHQILKLVIENLAAPPPAPEDGQIYYDTVDDIIKVWDGTAWQDATQLREHDHSNAANGGQLDFNVCFPSFVHDHENAADGGQLDLFAVADNTTKERYYSIPTADLQTEWDDDTGRHYGDYWQARSTPTHIYIGIHLPHGAVITKAVMYGAGWSTWELHRGKINDNTTDTTIASAARGVEDTTIATATVDNTQYNYWIKISNIDDGEDVYGGRITYTLTADNQG